MERDGRSSREHTEPSGCLGQAKRNMINAATSLDDGETPDLRPPRRRVREHNQNGEKYEGERGYDGDLPSRLGGERPWSRKGQLSRQSHACEGDPKRSATKFKRSSRATKPTRQASGNSGRRLTFCLTMSETASQTPASSSTVNTGLLMIVPTGLHRLAAYHSTRKLCDQTNSPKTCGQRKNVNGTTSSGTSKSVSVTIPTTCIGSAASSCSAHRLREATKVSASRHRWIPAVACAETRQVDSATIPMCVRIPAGNISYRRDD